MTHQDPAGKVVKRFFLHGLMRWIMKPIFLIHSHSWDETHPPFLPFSLPWTPPSLMPNAQLPPPSPRDHGQHGDGDENDMAHHRKPSNSLGRFRWSAIRSAQLLGSGEVRVARRWVRKNPGLVPTRACASQVQNAWTLVTGFSGFPGLEYTTSSDLGSTPWLSHHGFVGRGLGRRWEGGFPSSDQVEKLHFQWDGVYYQLWGRYLFNVFLCGSTYGRCENSVVVILTSWGSKFDAFEI